MTALDLTAHADEFRKIAETWHGYAGGPLCLYACTGTVTVGLSAAVRQCMIEVEKAPRSHDRLGTAFNLGRLLGHVAPLEDRLDPNRSCNDSPTGWHDYENSVCGWCGHNERSTE